MKLNTGLFLTVCYTQVIHTVQSTAGKRPKLQPPSGRDRNRREAELISAQNAFPRCRTLGRSRREAVMWEVHAAAASAFPSTEGYTASCKDEASQKKSEHGPEQEGPTPSPRSRNRTETSRERKRSGGGQRTQRTARRGRGTGRRKRKKNSSRWSCRRGAFVWWQQLPEASALLLGRGS